MFLVPISVCVLILVKAQRVTETLTSPLVDRLPIETIAGLAAAKVLAVLLIVAICFAAGLLSRSRRVSRLVERLESDYLVSVPGFTFLKGLAGGLADDQGEEQLAPMLVGFDDAWQVGLRIEDLGDGRAVLFLPGAPDPWSGSVVIMSEDRVQPIGRPMAAAVRNLRALGRGSKELLPAG